MEKLNQRETLSEVLRRELKDGEESLYKVTNATGVPKASLIRFVRGMQSLRLDMADRLAEHFGLVLRKVEGGTAEEQGKG